jgi:hypothetical protein
MLKSDLPEHGVCDHGEAKGEDEPNEADLDPAPTNTAQ